MKTFQTKLTSKGQLTLSGDSKITGRWSRRPYRIFLHRSGEVFVHGRNKPASAIFGKGAAYARRVSREQCERLVGEAVAAHGKPTTQRASHKRSRTG